MALSSRLFRGNRALESCAVQDSAHVTQGTTGEHVAKIQFALSELDGLVIDPVEVRAQRYGRSTAAAVLAYKRRRTIINRSYQNTADDIVGKMTIASMDKEMQQRELLPKPPGDCAVVPTGGPVPANAVNAPQRTSAFGGRQALAPKQLGGVVPVFFAITERAALEDGYPLLPNIEVARNLLFEHGITLSVQVSNGFADRIRFNAPIVQSEGNEVDNVSELRKASEDARPGLRGILRVIVCQMVGDHFGDTFRGRSIGGRIVPPFALLNSQIIDLSNATLIHEMIHASKDRAVDHDPEPASVFHTGTTKQGVPARTFLKPEHALTLSTMSSRL